MALEKQRADLGRDRVGELLEDGRLAGFRRRTMRARWPLPMGQSRCMMRAAVSCSCVSRRRRCSGNSGVSFSKRGRWRATSGSIPLTVSILSNALYFSLSLGSSHLTDDLVAAAQAETADLGQRHVDVVVGLHVAVRTQEPEAVGQYVEGAGALDRRRLGAALARFALAGSPLLAVVLAAVAAVAPRPRCGRDRAGPHAAAAGLRRPRRLLLA